MAACPFSFGKKFLIRFNSVWIYRAVLGSGQYGAIGLSNVPAVIEPAVNAGAGDFRKRVCHIAGIDPPKAYVS